jgi:hypothetical protein
MYMRSETHNRFRLSFRNTGYLRDTVTVYLRDTIYLRDTVYLRDTIYIRNTVRGVACRVSLGVWFSQWRRARFHVMFEN